MLDKYRITISADEMILLCLTFASSCILTVYVEMINYKYDVYLGVIKSKQMLASYRL